IGSLQTGQVACSLTIKPSLRALALSVAVADPHALHCWTYTELPRGSGPPWPLRRGIANPLAVCTQPSLTTCAPGASNETACPSGRVVTSVELTIPSLVSYSVLALVGNPNIGRIPAAA